MFLRVFFLLFKVSYFTSLVYCLLGTSVKFDHRMKGRNFQVFPEVPPTLPSRPYRPCPVVTAMSYGPFTPKNI